jgi:hypothetical protein
MAVDPEITELLRQINLARIAFELISEIAVPPGGDYKAGLRQAQDIAHEAMHEAGWLPQ